MTDFVKALIEVDKNATSQIANLEDVIENGSFTTEKDKATFGNYCTLLTGFRLVQKAVGALLANEGVIITDDGSYYQKLETETPTTAKGPGSDYDVDRENSQNGK